MTINREIYGFERSYDGGWFFSCRRCGEEHRQNPTYLPHPWTEAVCRQCHVHGAHELVVHRGYRRLNCEDCGTHSEQIVRWEDHRRARFECEHCRSVNVHGGEVRVRPPYPSHFHDVGLNHRFGDEALEDTKTLFDNLKGAMQSGDVFEEGRAVHGLARIVEILHAESADSGVPNNLGVLLMQWAKISSSVDVSADAIRLFETALSRPNSMEWRALTLHNVAIVKYRLAGLPDAGLWGYLPDAVLAEAAEACQQAIRIFRKHPPTHPESLGRIYGLLGDIQVKGDPESTEAASVSYETALETLGPTEPYYLSCLNRLAEGLATKAAAAKDERTAIALWARAEARSTQALEAQEKRGSRIDSADGNVTYAIRARARLAQGKYAGAIEDLKASLLMLESELDLQTSVDALRVFSRTHARNYLGLALRFAEMGDDLGALALMDRPLGQTTLFQRLPEEVRDRAIAAATARNAFRSVVAMFGGVPSKGVPDAEGIEQLQQIFTMMGHAINVKELLEQQADPSVSLARVKKTYAAILDVLGLMAERDDSAFFSIAIWQGEVLGYLILGSDQLERMPARRVSPADLGPILQFTANNFLGEVQTSAEELLARGSAGMERLGLDWVRERLKANRKRRLVVVPYGILTTFPFAASRGAGRYLVEEYEVAISPSLVLAAQVREPDEQIGLPRAVLIGNADPALEASKGEIETLSQRLRPSFAVESLVGQRCSRREVLSALATEPSIVHLAGHGSPNYFSGDQEAFIVGPDNSDGNHAVSSADLREHMKLARGAVVVLSYCSGLLSLTHGANDFQGMTATFLGSGASAVVGALWPVYDEVAAKFVEVFYGRLLDADDPVTALAAAQRALLQDGCNSYEWAPFAALVCG